MRFEMLCSPVPVHLRRADAMTNMTDKLLSNVVQNGVVHQVEWRGAAHQRLQHRWSRSSQGSSTEELTGLQRRHHNSLQPCHDEVQRTDHKWFVVLLQQVKSRPVLLNMNMGHRASTAT